MEPVTFARASLGLLALQVFLVTPLQIVGCWRSANRRTAETGKSLAGAVVNGLEGKGVSLIFQVFLA